MALARYHAMTTPFVFTVNTAGRQFRFELNEQSTPPSMVTFTCQDAQGNETSFIKLKLKFHFSHLETLVATRIFEVRSGAGVAIEVPLLNADCFSFHHMNLQSLYFRIQRERLQTDSQFPYTTVTFQLIRDDLRPTSYSLSIDMSTMEECKQVNECALRGYNSTLLRYPTDWRFQYQESIQALIDSGPHDVFIEDISGGRVGFQVGIGDIF